MDTMFSILGVIFVIILYVGLGVVIYLNTNAILRLKEKIDTISNICTSEINSIKRRISSIEKNNSEKED